MVAHPENKSPSEISCCTAPVNPNSTHATKSSELVKWNRLFWGALFCTLPVWLLSMRGMLLKTHFSGPLQAIFTFLSVFVFGKPVFEKAWLSFKTRNLNMFSLIAVGTLSSFLLSMGILIFGHETFHQEFYFEGAATLICFVLLGQILEAKASERTNRAIEALGELLPRMAKRFKSNGEEEEVLISQIKKGDLIKVLPGAKIPLDGRVIQGTTSVDESLVTGESLPVEKTVNSRVIAGTLNGLGTFLFQVEKEESETIISKIIASVFEAQAARIPIQQLADKVAASFIPWIFAIAFITTGLWWIQAKSAWVTAVYYGVSVLMIACPCALGLATPIAILVGTSLSAKFGILFRKPEAIQTLEEVDTLVFDKTGTLTQGRPSLITFRAFPDSESHHLLQVAASLENSSEHPLARSVLQAAEKKGITTYLKVSLFQNLPGKGILGLIGGKKVFLGNRELLESHHISCNAFLPQVQELLNKGETVIYLAIDKEVKALLGITDPLKETSERVLSNFRAQGFQLFIASGDHPKIVSEIAHQVGVKEWKAELKPIDKLNWVKELQSSGQKIVFLGDGINDAPALAQADVGIAMGSGTDVANESASITLVKGNLDGVVRALLLSSAMMKIIRQNLFWAFSYNIIGIPLAAGIFYPMWGIRLNPIFASLVMTLSSLLVVGNSLRLNRLVFRVAK